MYRALQNIALETSSSATESECGLYLFDLFQVSYLFLSVCSKSITRCFRGLVGRTLSGAQSLPPISGSGRPTQGSHTSCCVAFFGCISLPDIVPRYVTWCLHTLATSSTHHVPTASASTRCHSGWIGVGSQLKRHRVLAFAENVPPHPAISGPALDHYHCVRISAWAYLKGVSSLTLLHYLRRSLSPFSLLCAQKWP